MARHRLTLLAVLITCMGALLSSCMSTSEDGNGTGGEGTGSAESSAPDDGCTDKEFPRRLDVTTDNPDEVPYLDEFVACTTPGRDETWIKNDSKAVWTIEANPGGVDVTQLTTTATLESFRNIVRDVYEYAVLAPESSVRVDAEPVNVTWNLHPGFSSMWVAHELAVDSVKTRSKDQLTDMLSGNSLRREALITCAIAGYEVFGDKAGKLANSDPMEQFLASLGIFSGTAKCAKAWRQADDASRRVGGTATWDDVVRLGQAQEFFEKAETHLTRLNRLGQVIGHLH